MNYKEIIQNVLKNGQFKQPVRFNSDGAPMPVENATIGTFCEIFRHDMSEGFPLSTLRPMAFRSLSVELEGFIKGITDKAWYQERKCKFWNEWANPVVVDKEYNGDLNVISNGIDYPFPDKKQIQRRVADLGPIYGYQWRSFNKTYTRGASPQNEDDGDWNNYTDQLKSIVTKLKTNPYDRRMICSAWNPNQEYIMALPPCHYSWGVVVYGNKLNLSWNQRSCDLILGVGSNIASYALLQLLLCAESGLEPGELVGKLEDCHIYENQLTEANILAELNEKTLPQVEIKRKPDGGFSIFEWEYNETVLMNYEPHSKIELGAITV